MNTATAEAELLTPEQPDEAPKKSRAIAKRNGTPDEAIAPQRGGVDINVLLATAVQTGQIETMERVMAIRRELKEEAAKEAFFHALSAFQAECPIIKRTKAVKDPVSKGGATRYHYAPLDMIVRVVAPLLTKHGLSYTIESHVEPLSEAEAQIEAKVEIRFRTTGYLVALCKVYHEAGHMESSEFRTPIMGPEFMTKPQTFGAASTFAKRYAFTNALGILTGDDDTDARYTPQEAREARAATRQPVSQPRQTPTAQRAAAEKKANGNGKERVQIEPAGEGEAIDANTVKGLASAMEHATLTLEDFRKRFPKLNGPEQIKKTDTRAVMSWIASPSEN